MSIKLFDAELKVMEVLWKEGDLTAVQLTKIMNKETGWIRSTTYTVLKKLIDKGVFRNKDTIVTSILSREEFYGRQSRLYVKETFGSLPGFLTAFFQGRKISPKEAEELRSYIDHFEK